jgi:hypothetical protein
VLITEADVSRVLDDGGGAPGSVPVATAADAEPAPGDPLD